MATSYRLTVQRGPNVGKTYELVKDVVTLGRDMSNDIVINDSESSRHHARLTKQGVTYVLEDLGSTNGTFVNSARLSSPRPLSPGDVMGMGETIALTFEVITTPPTGSTMVGGSIDATVVASDKDMMGMMGSSMPEPVAEPPTASMPSYEPTPSYSTPEPVSTPSYSSTPASDSFTPAPPADGGAAGGGNRNMIIGIVIGVVVLCCCCPTVLGAAYYVLAPMLGF